MENYKIHIVKVGKKNSSKFEVVGFFKYEENAMKAVINLKKEVKPNMTIAMECVTMDNFAEKYMFLLLINDFKENSNQIKFRVFPEIKCSTDFTEKDLQTLDTVKENLIEAQCLMLKCSVYDEIIEKQSKILRKIREGIANRMIENKALLEEIFKQEDKSNDWE